MNDNGYRKNNNKQEDIFEDSDELSEYDELELLESLESAREIMEELGITTLVEVVQRIEELHKEFDRR
jgi:hypothetical protein